MNVDAVHTLKLPSSNPSDALDLTGLSIIAIGDERETLTRSYSADELADLFATRWVPYMECQECGRHSYCKFVEPHPYPGPRSVGRLAEIRCGVVVTAIRNYVGGTFALLRSLSREELQQFLDASYHLVRFIYDAEQQIGLMISSGHMRWLGEPEPRAMFFGLTARLRRHLDRFAGLLQNVEPFRTKATVILTEGPSEKAFLLKLEESPIVWFPSLDVQSYFGQGNRGPAKLHLLADRLHQDGHDLFIQGDCDGDIRDIFDQLVRQGIVHRDNTFAFDVDFETAFPASMLYKALHSMGMVDGVSFEFFDEALAKRGANESVLSVLACLLGTNIDKMELAESLGAVVNNSLFGLTDPDFSASEIGRFLDRIRALP